MASSRALVRSARTALRGDSCVFCQTRPTLRIGHEYAFRSTARTAQPFVSRRSYAQKLDVKRLRADVDKKSRLGWYKMTRGQKILLLEPDVAEAIYNDFVAHRDSKEYGKLVKQLVSKYNVTSEHISGLALMTYTIPDLSDTTKRAMLPPSPHKTNAALILQGCAEIEDPLAIKHIMAAVYLNTHTNASGTRDIALLFPRSEIAKYRKSLETLKIAGKDDPEALTLHGLFLEAENQPAKARALYEKALQVPWVYQFNVQARHPAQIPITAPWNALGYLLKSSPDPATREQAKWAFEQGATKGDDPLSCFEYATALDRHSADWVKFTSKAAASGHREAMLHLAQFYRAISGSDSPRSAAKQALDWLMGWRAGSASQLAEEWYETAGRAGHKGALLELAEWYESEVEMEKAREVLLRIVEPDQSGSGKGEEFAQVVHRAKGRLSGVRTA